VKSDGHSTRLTRFDLTAGLPTQICADVDTINSFGARNCRQLLQYVVIRRSVAASAIIFVVAVNVLLLAERFEISVIETSKVYENLHRSGAEVEQKATRRTENGIKSLEAKITL